MGCESSLVESGQMEEKEDEEEMGVLQLVCLAKTYDERDGKQRRCSNPYVHPGSLWSSLRGSKTQQNKTLTQFLLLYNKAWRCEVKNKNK